MIRDPVNCLVSLWTRSDCRELAGTAWEREGERRGAEGRGAEGREGRGGERRGGEGRGEEGDGYGNTGKGRKRQNYTHLKNNTHVKLVLGGGGVIQLPFGDLISCSVKVLDHGLAP